ncbi:transcription termination factor 4, mitochondrial-like [Ptychodera flava]|uniref:transcription termination factor 4, mitochondrial-like n=1 Tax=Ptychodera flava TaxID=63121 RepID=UPI00396A7352
MASQMFCKILKTFTFANHGTHRYMIHRKHPAKWFPISWSTPVSVQWMDHCGIRSHSSSCIFKVYSSKSVSLESKTVLSYDKLWMSSFNGENLHGREREGIDLLEKISVRNARMTNSRKDNFQLLNERLVDMGLGVEQIHQILHNNHTILNGKKDRLNESLMFLFHLNFSPNDVYRILTRTPCVLTVDVLQLNGRIRQLRKLGIPEGKLQRTIALCPSILLVANKQYKAVIRTLKECCGLTSEHIRQIIMTCPTIVHEHPDKIHVKFHYVYFTKNLTNLDEIVRARLFRHNVYHVRKRILFLERIGLFEIPDKKGNTKIENPSLKAMIDIPDHRFAKGVAKTTLEQYQMFSETLRQEDEREHDENESDYSSDEDTLE